MADVLKIWCVRVSSHITYLYKYFKYLKYKLMGIATTVHKKLRKWRWGCWTWTHIYGHKNLRKLTSKYHLAITETQPLDKSLENMGRMHRTTPLKPNLAMVSCLPYPWWYPRPEGPEQKSPPSTGQKTNKSTAGNISCIVGGFIPDWLTKKLVIRQQKKQASANSDLDGQLTSFSRNGKQRKNVCDTLQFSCSSSLFLA